MGKKKYTFTEDGQCVDPEVAFYDRMPTAMLRITLANNAAGWFYGIEMVDNVEANREPISTSNKPFRDRELCLVNALNRAESFAVKPGRTNILQQVREAKQRTSQLSIL